MFINNRSSPFIHPDNAKRRVLNGFLRISFKFRFLLSNKPCLVEGVNKNGRTIHQTTTSGQQGHSSRRSGDIKRLLLTRRFKHENIFQDLGIRVVGGKKLRDGDLGAFITSVDKSRAHETLGELREGDQVLEWNGVLLNGKTYEEVERTIQASTGEIELIVLSGRSKGSLQQRNAREEEDGYDGTDEDRLNEGKVPRAGVSGKRSIAFANDADKWHSPNEPPPIPAHQNSVSGGEEDNQRSADWGSRPANDGGGDMEEQHPLAGSFGKNAAQNGSHGYLQLALAYDRMEQILRLRVISARALQRRLQGVPPNPFVKIYMMPDRKVSTKRRTKYVPNSTNPIWDQQVEYLLGPEQLSGHFLEFTVYDYDRDRRSDNQPLGSCVVSLSDPSIVFGNTPRWFALQPPPSTVEEDDEPLANGAVPRSQPQQRAARGYNPATLDILNGYPAIA